MSSHSSTETSAPLTAAKKPSRPRGERRVAALLDAAGSVFLEKGVDAATMTEIARRAAAPIGSLYQFFPSKTALVHALLDRYSLALSNSLDDVAQMAATLSPAELAQQLIGVMLAHRRDRALAMLLLEGVTGVASEREAIRSKTLAQVEAILRAAGRLRGPGHAAAQALAVLHVMKSVPALAQLHDAGEADAIPDIETMLTLYLAAL